MELSKQEISSLEIERQKINKIDELLVKILDTRLEIVKNISTLKKKLGLEIFQPAREQQVLDKISKLSKNPEQNQNIFKKIMRESRNFQENLR